MDDQLKQHIRDYYERKRRDTEQTIRETQARHRCPNCGLIYQCECTLDQRLTAQENLRQADYQKRCEHVRG